MQRPVVGQGMLEGLLGQKKVPVAVPSCQRGGVSWQGPVRCSGPSDAVPDGRPSSAGMGSTEGVGQTQEDMKQ